MFRLRKLWLIDIWISYRKHAAPASAILGITGTEVDSSAARGVYWKPEINSSISVGEVIAGIRIAAAK